MIKHKARKEFTVSNLYSKIEIMKKKTIAIIQCILYLIAPYIALQLCRMNRSIVTDNLFFIFLILFAGLSLFLKAPITSFRKTIIFLKNK